MLPGDIIKAVLGPFVKGTKFENCEACNKRRLRINNIWTNWVKWIKGLLNK